MSTAKHSKLPWRVGRSPALGYPLLLTDAGYAIADEINGVTLEAAEANAALIVKSVNLLPEFVAALEAMVKSSCSACDLEKGTLIVEFTPQEWSAHVAATDQAKELLTRARQ